MKKILLLLLLAATITAVCLLPKSRKPANNNPGHSGGRSFVMIKNTPAPTSAAVSLPSPTLPVATQIPVSTVNLPVSTPTSTPTPASRPRPTITPALQSSTGSRPESPPQALAIQQYLQLKKMLPVTTGTFSADYDISIGYVLVKLKTPSSQSRIDFQQWLVDHNFTSVDPVNFKYIDL